MLKVLKFGGSSMADAKQFEKVKSIVQADPARRVVIVSAAGKRFSDDHKLTDLLYLCYAHLKYGVSCDSVFHMIRSRYIEIRDHLELNTDLETEFDALRRKMDAGISQDELVSRGEYFAAKLMADYLGYDFLDSELWLKFNLDGTVDQEKSYEILARMASGRRVVIPGFYGAMPDGSIKTFTRGGSDITGALAAAALDADVYENWTDVPGILTADPRIVKNPAPIASLSYPELQLLSGAGTQVLHESAVAPVRAAQIPLQILSTFAPELPGTRIGFEAGVGLEKTGVVGFAGRRAVSMLRVLFREAARADADTLVRACLAQRGVEVFHNSQGVEGLCLLLIAKPGQDALHAACDEVRRLLPGAQVKLRENLAALLALCRTTREVPKLAAAMESAGVPVHHLVQTPPGALFCVNDSQYETALRAAYALAFG